MEKIYNIDRKKFLKISLVAIGIIIGLVLIYKSIKYFLPFIIAFLIAQLMEPVIKLLSNKMKIPRKIGALISLIFIISIIGIIILLIIAGLIEQLKEIINFMPGFIGELYDNIQKLSSGQIKILNFEMPKEFTSHIESMAINLVSYFMNIINKIVKGAFYTAFSFPEILLFTLTTIISTYFIASGKYIIIGYLKSQVPKEWHNNIRIMKNDSIVSILKLIKAYIIILIITFSELFLGLSILKVKYALIIAILISIIDLLPVLGTGIVIIPWAIYNLLVGKIFLAVGLVLMWLVILIVRQVIEPRIISSQIGVHPLVTLMGIYVGFKLIGPGGLILGPLTVLTIKGILSMVLRGKTLYEFLKKPADKIIVK
ncbi:sporulation integral membrane protein YtvI [Clostridium sp. UBA4548]|uniref:sporulation integral membrane protein YtvI n=1 Tax=Clostridium sp. UBA4548 TaxID=1946361 RepID=UPI0025C5E6A8|nr:sporulation integral membrane protein YtvI [Clostridium sp. UBA4548]